MTGRRTKTLSGTIAASWTRRAARYAVSRGLDAEAMLGAVGLRSEMLEHPEARIAFREHVELLQAIEESLADTGVGIDIGATGRPEDFGAMGLLAETSATLRDALDMVQRFNPLANQASLATYWVEGERVYISDAHLPDGRPTPRVAAEATMTFYARTIVLTTGVLHPFFEICWAHARHPGWTTERAALFAGARVRFSAPRNALVAPAQLLDAPLHSARPALVPHLRSLAQRLLETVGDGADDLQKTAACLRASVQRQEPLCVDGAARALGCSTRTLQRRLGLAKITFRQLVDEVLRERAEELIVRGSLKLSEVADLLGYSDVRALRRACQRWFGAPPAELRAQGSRARAKV
ncbi:AraC family transcriptional regulator ligand-binding domain-containing protein [Sorangium sp. So ce362]|uniref:AraC family transcriptional regulator n=1 Tax=Sorangium sp. So ce362 TaxID=3133303 RepID=UPI003F5ECD4F